MPFKNDYLTTVGITPATYASGASAADRVCGIYSTARTGRITATVGGQLWISFFAPLVSQLSALPATQAGYDLFATNQMLRLAGLLRQRQRGDFGHAQKMFNLFLKDHWALDTLPSQSETLLHLPLDRIVLSKLNTIPPPWTAWTKVVVASNTQQHVVSTYLEIQDSFRAYWQQMTPRFLSPIEMEQFIWHRI